LMVHMPSEARKANADSEVTNAKPGKGALNLRLEHTQAGWKVQEMGLM
jgi:hypothetical protein